MHKHIDKHTRRSHSFHFKMLAFVSLVQCKTQEKLDPNYVLAGGLS